MSLTSFTTVVGHLRCGETKGHSCKTGWSGFGSGNLRFVAYRDVKVGIADIER